MTRSHRRCTRQSSSAGLSLAVALFAGASLTTCATTSSAGAAAGTTTEQSNDTHHPNDIHKLHHLLPSFLFASAAEQQQEMMKPPPSKSFASRMCGAGSNADKEGECANADTNDETVESDAESLVEGEEDEEEEHAYAESTVDPETCAKWVTEDATRCLHPERRPEMLGRCADACRDIAGVTAKDLTEEQMYEDAARGYVYYYHVLEEEEEEEGEEGDGEEAVAEEEEGEEEEYECIDYEERCKEWIWEHNGCWHNYEHMEEYCPRSCNVCYTEGELNVINFGVPQLTNYHDDEATNAAIRENIEETAEYMLNHVLAEERFENVRRDCFNFDPKCSYYAATGWCTDELELRWMQTTCGPACQACMTVDYWHRCGSKPDMEDAIGDEDMVPVFERIIDNYPKDKISILSHPESREDFLEARGLELTEVEPAVDYTALGYKHFNDWVENQKDWIEDLDHEKPYVITLDNFLSDEECDHFIKEGYRLGFEQSTKVVDLGDEGMMSDEGLVDSGRTSRNTFCSDDCYDSEINMAVMNRIEALTGIPKENSEDLQLLKYEVDEHYEEHHDAVWHWNELFCGNRIITVFLYLNDVEEGGETRLNALNIDVKPKKGMALIWPSVRNDDTAALEDWAWHEAQPVKKGQKFGANAWLRMRNYKDWEGHCDM